MIHEMGQVILPQFFIGVTKGKVTLLISIDYCLDGGDPLHHGIVIKNRSPI